MTEESAEIIRGMVARGFAAELLALLYGESVYNSPTSPGAPAESSARRLRTDAILHLTYVIKTVRTEGNAEVDGKFYGAYPEEFEKWIEGGAPGITEDELLAFAADHSEVRRPG
jgi:hypothetical protein